MEDLNLVLKNISKAVHLKPVIHVAAFAGLLVAWEYYSILDMCEAYGIAIGECCILSFSTIAYSLSSYVSTLKAAIVCGKRLVRGKDYND
jgi:hypothetical protein